MAIGLGFGWVATEFPLFLTVIKYAGSAYVLFLAWGLFRAGSVDSEVKAKHAGFLDGVILLVLNPKAYLIIVLMFTQFTASSQQVQIGLVLLVSTVFTLNNAVAFSLWAFAGDRLALVFRDDGNARRLNIVFGCVLTMVAIWMLTG